MKTCFFFFQAEDGIRDHCVTGVQTCALPISRGGVSQVEHHRAGDCAAVDEHHGSGGHRRAPAVPIHWPDPMHPEPRRAPVELSVWHEPGRHSEGQPVILSGYAGRLTVAGNHTAYLLLSSNPLGVALNVTVTR